MDLFPLQASKEGGGGRG